MTSAELFLRSVRDVFARNREADWAQIGMLLGGAVAVSVVLSLLIARHRRQSEVGRRIDAVTLRAGLGHAELDYLGKIAAAADLPLLEVMTRLPAFERATAGALASHPEATRPAPGSLYERIRRLRKALGHYPLPAHHWLLSTRELLIGDPVTLGKATGKVVDVSEASFVVDLPVDVVPSVGEAANLAIVRPDDSRYLSRARVMAAEPTAGPADESARQTDESAEGFHRSERSSYGSPFRRVYFAHDEQPERQQNREHVRVRVSAVVTLRFVNPARKPSRAVSVARPGRGEPDADNGDRGLDSAGAPGVEGRPEPETPPAAVEGTMVDVSAGGMAVDLTIAAAALLRRGTRVRCSFALGESGAFNDVAAVVVAPPVAAQRSGLQHVRLSFVALPDAERDRLSSAVTRQQRPVVENPIAGS